MKKGGYICTPVSISIKMWAGCIPEAFHRLIPHDSLLNGGEGLEGRQQTMHVLLAAHQHSERAKLLGQRQQNLVLQQCVEPRH